MATLSPSLKQLAREVAPGFPRRGTSDGWLADQHHSGASDHQPDSRGIVHAIDIDKDGVKIPIENVVKICIGDYRTEYVIFRGLIYSRTYVFRPRKYTGPNPHNEHIHISGRYGPTYENDTSPWFEPQPQPQPQPQEDDVPEITRKLFRIDGGDRIFMTHMKADLKLGKVHIASREAFQALGFDPAWLQAGRQEIDNVPGSHYLAKLPDLGSVG